MERLRKVIASLGVVAILSTLMVTSVANADWWDTYVDELVTAGVLDSADDYRAGDNLTRMELVEFAVAAFSLEGTTAIDFSDVPATHAGYATLQTAVANGVVKGYDDGTFKPDNPVLRSELVKILVEAGDLPECDVDNPFNDVPSSVWYADYAVTAYCNSVIDGYSDGSFGGAKNTARSEAAKMVSVSMTPVVREDVEEEEDEESSELEGGAGSVEEYKLVTSYQNEEVGEGADDVVVYGMTVEASDSSDLNITALRLVFNEGTATSDFDKYAEDVSVWFEDEEVARLDADEFTDDNAWTKTVSLDDDAIIRMSEVGEFNIAVTGISNLDSADATDTWTLDITSVRYVDAQSAVISEDPTLAVRTFSFETYATAADTELKLAAGDDDVNEGHVVDIDDVNDTNGVDVLSFTWEVKGTSDINLKAVPVNFDVTGTAAHVDSVASAFYLYIDAEEVSSVTVGSGSDCIEDFIATADCTNVGVDETYLFDDVDTLLTAGETYDLLVKADINDTTALAFVDGDTLAANVINSYLDNDINGDGLVTVGVDIYIGNDGFDAEDEEGDNLLAADTTGSVTGEAIAFYDAGIQVDLVSVSKSKTSLADPATSNTVDSGTFTITMDITAFGADQYVDYTGTHNNTSPILATDPASANGNGILYDVWFNGADTATGVASANYSVNGALVEAAGSETEDGTAAYVVKEGETREFVFSVVVAPAPEVAGQDDGQYEVRIDGISWSNADGDIDFVALTDEVYDFNLDTFKTGNLYLQEID